MVDVYGAAARRGLTATLTMLGAAGRRVRDLQYGLVMHRTLLFDGLYVADPLAAFLKLVGLRRRGHRDILFAGLSGAARHPRRGVLRAVPDGACSACSC